MARPSARPFVSVAVFSWDGRLLPGAQVLLRTSPAGSPISLGFDTVWKSHVATHMPPGFYRLQALAAGFAAQEREVVIEPTGLREFVMLGEPEMPFFYSDRVRVPFRPDRELLALAVDQSADREAEAVQLAELMARWRLVLVELPEPVREAGVLAFRVDKNTSDARIREILHDMAAWPLAEASGQVLRLDKESITFLSQDIVAQFRPKTALHEVTGTAERNGLEVLGPLPYLDNGYVLRASDGSYAAVLDVWLNRSSRVAWSCFRLGSREHAVTNAGRPARLPVPAAGPHEQGRADLGAGALRANKGVNRTYGSPDVIIAVLDQQVGCSSRLVLSRARKSQSPGQPHRWRPQSVRVLRLPEEAPR